MKKVIWLYPQTKEAARWLSLHRQELANAFRRVHRGGARADHPHGMDFPVPPVTDDSFFEPDRASSEVLGAVLVDGDEEHANETIRDILAVLAELGATPSEFSVKAAD